MSALTTISFSRVLCVVDRSPWRSKVKGTSLTALLSSIGVKDGQGDTSSSRAIEAGKGKGRDPDLEAAKGVGG